MPSAAYKEQPVTFEQGLVTRFEPSLIPNGSLAAVDNFVPEETGGLRVREGWKASTTTGSPSPAKGLGLGIYTATSRVFRQRSVSTINSGAGLSAGRTITYNWPSSTAQGSLLIMKIGVDVLSGGALLQELDVGAAGSVTKTWQRAQTMTYSQTGALGHGGLIYVKENADPESSGTFTIKSNDASAPTLVIELVEIQSVLFGTPKNLVPAAWSDGEVEQSAVAEGDSYTDGTLMQGWTASGPATAGTFYRGLGSNALSGNGCYVYRSNNHNPANTETAQTLTGTNGMPVSANTQYTGSLYIQKSSGTDVDITPIIQWYTAAGASISTSTGSTTTGLTSSYTRLTVTATSPANAAYASVGFKITSGVNTTSTYHYDQIQFEQGSSATTWVQGGITCIDQMSQVVDLTSPVSLTGLTATVSSSWAEATVFGWDNANTTVSNTSWSNNYSAGSDSYAYIAINSSNAYLASASKILTSATTFATDAAFTNFTWGAGSGSAVGSYMNIKLATSSAISLNKYYVAAHNNTTATSLYYINQSDIASGTYSLIETITGTPDGSPVAMASGLGSLVYTNPGMTTARRWSGPSSTPIALSPAGGTAVAFFKSRFFIGGNPSNPTRLVYSDIGSTTSWPASSYLEVGQDDGYTITDLAVQENYLIIGKGNSIWTLSGSGADTFALYQLPTGDAAPGRSICITPQGAVVAGYSAVWQISGTSIESISKNMAGTYDPAGYVHTAYNDGFVYILDVSAQKIYVCNLSSNAWHTESFSSANNQLVALKDAGAGRILGSPTSSTDTGLIMYKDLPSLTRTRDFSALTSTATMSTPVMWLGGPGVRVTPRYLFLQVRQRGISQLTGQELVVTPYYDEQVAPAITLSPRTDEGSWRYRVDLGRQRGIDSVQFVINGPSTGNQFDIESAVVGYDVEAIR